MEVCPSMKRREDQFIREAITTIGNRRSIMKSFLTSCLFYFSYFVYRFIDKKSTDLKGLLPVAIGFKKGSRNKVYVIMGDRRCTTEKLKNIDARIMINKFGFYKCVKKKEYNWADSIFNMDRYFFSMASVYRESDLPKLELVNDLINRRIKGSKKF